MGVQKPFCRACHSVLIDNLGFLVSPFFTHTQGRSTGDRGLSLWRTGQPARPKMRKVVIRTGRRTRSAARVPSMVKPTKPPK